MTFLWQRYLMLINGRPTWQTNCAASSNQPKLDLPAGWIVAYVARGEVGPMHLFPERSNVSVDEVDLWDASAVAIAKDHGETFKPASVEYTQRDWLEQLVEADIAQAWRSNWRDCDPAYQAAVEAEIDAETENSEREHEYAMSRGV